MDTSVLMPWLSSIDTGGLRHAMQVFQGDGTSGPWEFNFAGGYISAAHIKAYRYDPASSTAFPQTLTLIGSNQIVTDETIPPDQYLVLYRNTPKDTPLVDYSDGAVLNETNLDMTAQQAVFAAAEMVDRFSAVNVAVNEAVAAADAAAAAANAAVASTAADAATAAAAAAQAQARWDDISSKFTVSTNPPSGGKDGDIWFQVTT